MPYIKHSYDEKVKKKQLKSNIMIVNNSNNYSVMTACWKVSVFG